MCAILYALVLGQLKRISKELVVPSAQEVINAIDGARAWDVEDWVCDILLMRMLLVKLFLLFLPRTLNKLAQ